MEEVGRDKEGGGAGGEGGGARRRGGATPGLSGPDEVCIDPGPTASPAPCPLRDARQGPGGGRGRPKEQAEEALRMKAEGKSRAGTERRDEASVPAQSLESQRP